MSAVAHMALGKMSSRLPPTVERQSILADASRRENSAQHSWYLAVLAVCLSEYAATPGIDLFKVVKMLLLHDFVEIDAGDAFLYDAEALAAQVAKEHAAAEAHLRTLARLNAGGLADLVEIREGDALQTLARYLPSPIDLVLLDGAKALYPDIASLVEGRLRPGALVTADNADDSPDYLARVRAPNSGYLSTRVAEGVELSIWVG